LNKSANAVLEMSEGKVDVEIRTDESDATKVIFSSNLTVIPYVSNDQNLSTNSPDSTAAIQAYSPEEFVKLVMASGVVGTEEIDCDSCFRYVGFHWSNLKQHFVVFAIKDLLESLKFNQGNPIILKAKYGFYGNVHKFRVNVNNIAQFSDPRIDSSFFDIVPVWQQILESAPPNTVL